jgi:RNA polymerase sigma-70 factor, ECF subfamily
MDANQFRKEVLPLKNKLYRFASVLLNDTEEAQDATQDVFLKLWNLREQIHKLNSTEAFAMTVMKNHCLDRIKARRTVSLEQTKSLFFENSEQENPEKQTEERDSLMHIKKMMALLPEQQRMIMQLRDIEGYEFEEIGQALGISLNTIRVNLSRARKKIRDMYQNSLINGTGKNKSITG